MDSQWLKRQFDCNPEKSKAGLARLLRLEPPAISKILSGTRQIKAQEYNMMRQYFDLPVDGEDTALKIPENAYRLDTLAGQDNILEDSSSGTTHDSWIIPADILSARTHTPPEQIKIYSVIESVMEPDFKRGEHVLIDLFDTKPTPPGSFIISDGFGIMVRNCAYIPNSNPPEIKISASSKSFQTQSLQEDDFKIIGRIIAKLQWL